MKVKIAASYVIYIMVLALSITYIFTCSDNLELNVFLLMENESETTRRDEDKYEATTDKKNESESTTEIESQETTTIYENQLTTSNNDTTYNEDTSGDDTATKKETTTEERTTEEETTTSEADNYDYYYNDGEVRIAITKVVERSAHQTYYVADVQLSSVKYFKSLFAYGRYSTNLRQGTTTMAKMSGSIFAVSGDYYNQRSNSVVIRNGVLYSEDDPERDILIMYENGDLEVIHSGQCPSGEELIDMGVINSYSFGPGIVENGKAVDEVRYTSSYIKERHPRMLIGQVDTLHYIFVAVDGRDENAIGMDIYECGELMESLGCEVAYNLDGGGSTTMVFDGKIVNVPSQGSERSISDAIGILGGDD